MSIFKLNILVSFAVFFCFIQNLIAQQHHSSFPIGYYLTQKKFIALAQVKKVGRFDFYAEIDEWVKPEMDKRKKIKVRYNYSFKKTEQEQNFNELNLIPAQHYLFFFSYKNENPKRLILRENNRFKVINDSIFIGSKFLQGLPFENKELLMQTNTFNDSAMPFGYKISLSDLFNLMDILRGAINFESGNKCWIFSEIKSDNPFTIAVIEAFKSCYECNDSRPVNLPD